MTSFKSVLCTLVLCSSVISIGLPANADSSSDLAAAEKAETDCLAKAKTDAETQKCFDDYQKASQAIMNADLTAVLNTEQSCINQNLTEMGMKECAGAAYQSADAILNKVYKQATLSLQSSKEASDQEILKRLVSSEKAWVAYKETDCSLQGTTDLGGSNEGLDILSCLVSTTVSRVKELRSITGDANK